MRYAIHTRSGARYMIDESKMTWKRDGSNSDQDVVMGVDTMLGNDGKSGTLYTLPLIQIGYRATIQIGRSYSDYITTTAVQRIELLED